MCVQADSSLSVRGEVVQVSRNRIARSVATRYRMWAKGWRLADMPFRSKECLKRMPTSYPDHLSGGTNVI